MIQLAIYEMIQTCRIFPSLNIVHLQSSFVGGFFYFLVVVLNESLLLPFTSIFFYPRFNVAVYFNLFYSICTTKFD